MPIDEDLPSLEALAEKVTKTNDDKQFLKVSVTLTLRNCFSSLVLFTFSASASRLGKSSSMGIGLSQNSTRLDLLVRLVESIPGDLQI